MSGNDERIPKWVLVPMEATDTMALAGEAAHEEQEARGSLWQAKYGWSAMVDTAPVPAAYTEALAFRFQSIMDKYLTVDEDDIMGVGRASFAIARAFVDVVPEIDTDFTGDKPWDYAKLSGELSAAIPLHDSKSEFGLLLEDAAAALAQVARHAKKAGEVVDKHMPSALGVSRG